MVIAIWHIQDRASYLAQAKWTAVVDWLQGTNTMSTQCVWSDTYCCPFFPHNSKSVLRRSAPISALPLCGNSLARCDPFKGLDSKIKLRFNFIKINL